MHGHKKSSLYRQGVIDPIFDHPGTGVAEHLFDGEFPGQTEPAGNRAPMPMIFRSDMTWDVKLPC